MSPAPTVFVVDDDASIRELLAWLMKRNDLPVEAFADAREFLAAYTPDRPGCLVLDLHLPGMNGLELQQYLKSQGVLIPVIFLSGGAAVVVDGRDPGDYVHALERLDDPEEREELIQKGWARARQFTWQKTATLTAEVYKPLF